ncbi:hypothetical protein H5407_22665 [Mitsuaria sp. WAJ17]|uniref:hypothetical protein n=1 Tax=Mitsuaria sp. WAJ17 TaxID=2761452 RepID=UPI001601A2C2|nr:hypothetical protein [Mitsuaria sp. WAJ17]MBB2488049.1 hypothetical protein [Mitsuaria sp. WAJ17]
MATMSRVTGAAGRQRWQWALTQAVARLRRSWGAWIWGWALAGLLLAASALLWSWQQQRLLDQQIAWQLAGERVRAAARPASQTDAPLLDISLASHAQVPELLGQLLTQASEQGLRVDGGSYQWQQRDSEPLQRFVMTLPLKGSASSLFAFIQAATRGNGSLALEAAAIKRASVDAEQVEAQLRWVMYVAPDVAVGRSKP